MPLTVDVFSGSSAVSAILERRKFLMTEESSDSDSDEDWS